MQSAIYRKQKPMKRLDLSEENGNAYMYHHHLGNGSFIMM